MEKIIIKWIKENVCRLRETGSGPSVDAYLIIGTKCAVVIDGLEKAEGMYDIVKKMTEKPVCMIVTHGHPDHSGRGMQEFMEAGCRIYISPRDVYMLEKRYGEKLRRENLWELKDGMEFDLGDTSLKILNMPGHTKGSALVYMEKEKILFSSDAIGSGGLWMQLKESSPLTDYLKELQKLEDFLEINGPVKIYPGHSQQIHPYIEKEQDYLDIQYVRELMEMTGNIIGKRLVGDRVEIPMEEMKGIRIRSAKGKLVWDYCYDDLKVIVPGKEKKSEII